MNLTTVVMNGMLRPDGTLEVGTISTLPAGPVKVTVQPVDAMILPSRDPIEALAEIRRMQAESGYQGKTHDQILRDEQAARAEDEEEEARWREIYSHTKSFRDFEDSR